MLASTSFNVAQSSNDDAWLLFICCTLPCHSPCVLPSWSTQRRIKKRLDWLGCLVIMLCLNYCLYSIGFFVLHAVNVPYIARSYLGLNSIKEYNESYTHPYITHTKPTPLYALL